MPNDFCATDILAPGNPDDVCAVMRKLLQDHEYLKLLTGYIVDCENGNLPQKQFALEVAAQVAVEGVIQAYMPKARVYEDVKAEVENLWGPPDPIHGTWWRLVEDMKGMFLLAASEDHTPGEHKGEETVTLGLEEIPEHDHDVYAAQAQSTIANAAANRFLFTPQKKRLQGDQDGGQAGSGSIENFPEVELGMKVGGGKPHNNMPPYYTVVWITRTKRTQ